MVWSKGLPEVFKYTCFFQHGFVESNNVDLGWILGEVLWWWRLSANITLITSQIHGFATAMQAPLQEICLCVIERHLGLLWCEGNYSSGFSAFGATSQSCTWKHVLSWWVGKISFDLERPSILVPTAFNTSSAAGTRVWAAASWGVSDRLCEWALKMLCLLFIS